MTIYLADLLEGDGRAFRLAPSTDHLGGMADAHGARFGAAASASRLCPLYLQ
jgi:hypothetical protein